LAAEPARSKSAPSVGARWAPPAEIGAGRGIASLFRFTEPYFGESTISI
jgi:hypothetical protein